MQTWICTYDISNSIIRKQISKILLNYGQRIQYSVFELHFKLGMQSILNNKLAINLQQNDSIRWYQICKNCQKLNISYGRANSITKPDYFLI